MQSVPSCNSVLLQFTPTNAFGNHKLLKKFEQNFRFVKVSTCKKFEQNFCLAGLIIIIYINLLRTFLSTGASTHEKITATTELISDVTILILIASNAGTNALPDNISVIIFLEK